MSNLREVDVCLKRIRELEADCNGWLVTASKLSDLKDQLKARAEKAEARVAELDLLRKTSGKHDDLLGPVALAEAVMGGPNWRARAEKAEARVAELEVYQKQHETVGACAEMIHQVEARVALLEALIQRAIGFGLGESWEHEAATLLEAREREAE